MHENGTGPITISAADGVPLVLERLRRPAGRAGTPVVLCPGLGGNRHNFDADEDHSLARCLLREGYDVWIVELRGYGRSLSPRVRSAGWTMDDHVEQDVPALLEAIAERSGQPRVVWIGHSLGGMVSYCFLARFPNAGRRIAGLVTLGAPGHVERPGGFLLPPALALARVTLPRRAMVPTRLIGRLLFSAAGRRLGLRRLWRFWLNPDNMTQAVIGATVRHGLEDLPFGTLHQWLCSMRAGSLCCLDGSFDYFEHMGRIDVPALFVGGMADRISPVPRVRRVFDQVGSADKTLRAFGRCGYEVRRGEEQRPCRDTADYGHDDLLLGEANRTELFPYVAAWLRTRFAATVAPATRDVSAEP